MIWAIFTGCRSDRREAALTIPSNAFLYITQFHAMDIKVILLVLTAVFVVATLFFGTRNGFYDTDNYHGNGSAH